ncbi:unnamed protein product [Polarella glacialis]|uniref:Uncharacterized protein n=1 Tax=Polarella glacialis TaxID=89957 RepID=A0A813KRH8_POLGL|nr:unnamed protein product [Polarella glacialis]
MTGTMGWPENDLEGDAPDVYEDIGVGETPGATPRLSDRENLQVLGHPQALEEEVGVPAAVQRILLLRRDEDRRNEESAAAEGYPQQRPSSGGAFAGAPGRPSSEDWTPQLQDFSEEVRLLREQALHQPPQQLEVKTFFDLQAYNLDPYAGKLRKEPGSMQLMYMFYSRIYEKLVGKQKGVEVPLFAPANFGDRSLGFRAILDWARDFRVSPARVTRKELERIFVTVHGGSMPALEKFTSKITYTEFVTFVVLCGTAGEPMDRSKVDGSRVREIETRLEQVKRLSTCLFLANSKKVKLGLHDAWRDVHFWKLSDGADFEKEARACEMRSRPQHRVDAIDIPEGCQDTAAARRYLDQFTWSQKDHLWEEFEAPCLDMGAFVLAGAVKKFRVSITNRGFSLCRLKLDVSSVGPVRLPWRDGTLGPGQSAEVMIEVVPMECGEWRGDIVASASWTGGFASPAEEIRIPTYVKVLQPQKGGSDAIASRLPLHAPRPFRPGSVCRISVDPACSHNQQLRAPTPHGRGSRPGSAVALSSSGGAKPPRPSSCGALLPQRAGSAGGSTAVPSRPLSVLASSRCCSSAAAGPPSSLGQVGKYCGLVPPTSPTPTPMRNFGDKAFDGYAMDVRPRSAPSAPLASPLPSSASASARSRPAPASGRPHSAGVHAGARRRAGSHQ